MNARELADSLGLDIEVIERLVATFVAATRRDLRELELALAEKDCDATARIAHHIKGAAAGLELESIRCAAESLERHALDGRLVDADALRARLGSDLKALGSGGAESIPEPECPGDPAGHTDVGEQ